MPDNEQYALRSEYGYQPGDNPNFAAGILPICTSTKRALICLRSSKVDQPHTWGTWGGTIKDGENFVDGAKREFNEESGFTGAIKLIPAHLFKNSRIQYQNFIGLVGEEFTPHDSWEADDYAWCNYQELWEIEPKHFGLEILLENSGKLVNKYLLPVDYKGDLVEKILKEGYGKTLDVNKIKVDEDGRIAGEEHKIIQKYLDEYLMEYSLEGFNDSIFKKMYKVDEWCNTGKIYRVLFVERDKLNNKLFNYILNRNGTRFTSFSKSENGVDTFIEGVGSEYYNNGEIPVVISQISRYIDLYKLYDERIFDLSQEVQIHQEVIAPLSLNFKIEEIRK